MNHQHGSNTQSNQTARAKPLRGVLQPDKSLPASLIAGSRLKYTLIALFAVFSQIRWDALYAKAWYRVFVDFMATIYPTIDKIPGTPSQFPEYAMGLLAFCHAIGPFYVAFFLFYGVKHAKVIDLDIIAEIPTGKKIILLIGAIVFLMLFSAAPIVWTGHSFHFPTLFYQSKSAFLAMTLMLWVVMCAFAFGTSALFTSVIMLWRRR